jgi:iron complex transport system substrate-binding protein
VAAAHRLRGLEALVLAAALLAGCGEPSAPPEPERGTPGRILTLAPNLTEIAFALGLGDRVVGVSDYTSWPPEARELPRLGGLFDPNLERMVALEPDLALLLPSQASVARNLAQVGIETLTLEIETVDDLETALLAVGERCGAEAAAGELARTLRAQLAPRPIPGAPATVVVLDRAPGRTEGLLVAGPGTYFHELLGRLGAANAFADAPLRYPQVGMEEVLARAPEVVLEVRPGPLPEEARGRLLADWRRFPDLPAVAHGEVGTIVGEWTMILGPRLPRLYQEMEEALQRAAHGAGAP